MEKTKTRTVKKKYLKWSKAFEITKEIAPLVLEGAAAVAPAATVAVASMHNNKKDK